MQADDVRSGRGASDAGVLAGDAAADVAARGRERRPRVVQCGYPPARDAGEYGYLYLSDRQTDRHIKEDINQTQNALGTHESLPEYQLPPHPKSPRASSESGEAPTTAAAC